MIGIPQKAVALALAIAFFLTGGLLCGQDVVLCVGDDGHWDIEFTSCESDSVFDPPREVGGEDHHGNCSDVKLCSCGHDHSTVAPRTSLIKFKTASATVAASPRCAPSGPSIGHVLSRSRHAGASPPSTHVILQV